MTQSAPLTEKEATTLVVRLIRPNQPATRAAVMAVLTNQAPLTKAKIDAALREMLADG